MSISDTLKTMPGTLAAAKSLRARVLSEVRTMLDGTPVTLDETRVLLDGHHVVSVTSHLSLVGSAVRIQFCVEPSGRERLIDFPVTTQPAPHGDFSSPDSMAYVLAVEVVTAALWNWETWLASQGADEHRSGRRGKPPRGTVERLPDAEAKKHGCPATLMRAMGFVVRARPGYVTGSLGEGSSCHVLRLDRADRFPVRVHWAVDEFDGFGGNATVEVTSAVELAEFMSR